MAFYEPEGDLVTKIALGLPVHDLIKSSLFNLLKCQPEDAETSLARRQNKSSNKSLLRLFIAIKIFKLKKV